MHILFVCSRNRWRSLTAEKIFNGVNGNEVRSAGTEENARIRVTAGLIGWADWILTMERKHVRRLKEKFPQALQGKRLICLDIPDEFGYMDEALIGLLESSVSVYVDLYN
ncbi:low molecular weight protein tyrosine phosphatase family protein [Paenibacillus sp. S-38]|uniref:low molecular weight protein tyrosine phosphatase family protein n=1 Tax=Paenibacillus sp. S-38 TaxID=3416710 RepID=UPI003CFA003C